jgi:hypothetical protein
MVMCRLGVMFCGASMMFDGLLDFGHLNLP